MTIVRTGAALGAGSGTIRLAPSFLPTFSIRTLVDRTATRILLILTVIPQMTTGGRPRPARVCCGC